MTKKRKKILIISAVALMVMIAIAVTTVFAYNVIVDYNYKQKAHASLLTAELVGDKKVVVKRSEGQLLATHADIILVSKDENLELAGQAAAHTADFVHTDGETYFKQVFVGLQLLDDSDSEFLASTPINTVIYAAVGKARYVDTSGVKNVVYENRYVSSLLQLQLLNFQSNYNNIFELAGNYYGKTVYARTVYILSDLTFDEEYTINHPCSINLLNSSLTLNAKLTIYHSYAGQYFVDELDAGEFGAGKIEGNGNFVINTPKAYYRVNEGLKAQLGVRLEEIYDFSSYAHLIFDDALDFAQKLLPNKVFSSVTLQPLYQTFGIRFEYYYLDEHDVEQDFIGGVSDLPDLPKGYLPRTADSQTYTVRIKAITETGNQFRDVEIMVVGSSAQSIVDYLADGFAESFLNSNGKIFSAINLKPVFLEIYTAGGYQGEITMAIEESNSINIDDENSVRLVLNGVAAAEYTVDGAILQSATDFSFRLGTITQSDSLVVTFAGGGAQNIKTFDLELSAKSEVLYYLKSASPAFVTGSEYGVLNIDAAGTGVYLGESLLTSSLLGLKSIEYSLVSVTDSVMVDENILDYFLQESDGRVLKLSPDAQVLPKEMYLQYTCTFDDGIVQTFLLRATESSAQDGGDSQQFESANPFDQLFMNTETNWLEGGTFDVPTTAVDNFARIEIISIDGFDYNPANPYNMCYIENDTDNPDTVFTDPTEFIDFYKSIDFVTDLKYVPDKNSVVKVRCTYYNSEAKDTVLIQEYSITINGIFKCGDLSTQPPEQTPFVFTDSDFYGMTIKLFQDYYAESAPSYVSILSDGEELLLSNSANAKLELDYSSLSYTGAGVDTQGLHRLNNIPLIRMDGIRIADMSCFSLMVGSALKTLSLANCQLLDGGLYAGGAGQSYLFEIQLGTVNLDGNSLTRTDNLLSRTVTKLNISGQRDSGDNACLVDIAGLISIKDLEVLDVSDNAIYRFEVLKSFSKLKTVYLFDNRVSDDDTQTEPETYGTDGITNIPNYVWMMHTGNTKIFANPNNLSDDESTGGFLKFGTNFDLFSKGGDITKDMQEGSVALNAFAAPTKLFNADGKEQMENDLRNLVVQIGGGGAGGGLEQGVTSSYIFEFANPYSLQPSTDFVLLKDYQVVSTLTRQGEYEKCSYIVVIVRQSDNKPLAYREFLIDVYYNYKDQA